MLSKYVKVSDKFNSSVNLNYDLTNLEKINNFIPTNDLCDVIKMYLKMILGINTAKSINLVGPYGKGKSYLLLVLSFIVSNNSDKVVFDNLINKISKIDSETADLIKRVSDTKLRLLPVIINNQFSDVNQSFLLGLTNSLETFNLTSIIPKTIFSHCLDTIKRWEIETKKNKGFNIFDTCLNELRISLVELKNELKTYSKNSLEKFKKLFKCVTYGVEFSPLVANDIATIFKEVNEGITKLDYNGMFVVFDEFSVFLSTHNEDLRENMLKIQKISELATNDFSVDKQISFTVVTHKNLELYNDLDSITTKDAFKAIEGRFSNIRFERSLEENYQIFGSAIIKKKAYQNYLKDLQLEKNDFFTRLKSTTIISSEVIDFLFENTTPFNPLSLYLLIRVSEIIAQNERTLFTFLQDNDKFGFKHFINNNDEGSLINSDLIFDYFNFVIKENVLTKDLWHKVSATCALTNNVLEQKVLKTIGLINLNNDFLKLSSTIENISLLLNLTINETKKVINDLEQKLLVKVSLIDNTVNFSVSSDSNVDSLIKNLIKTDLTNPFSYYLNLIYDDKFIKSSRYNFEYSMFRFVENIFIESSSLNKLSDISSVTNNLSDGTIINVIEDEKLNKEVLQVENSSIIFRIIKCKLDNKFINRIKNFFALEALLKRNNLDDVLRIKLEIMKLDTYNESNLLIDKLLKDGTFYYQGVKHNNESELIYKSLTTTFNKTVILINEAINRNFLTKISEKAVINITNKILGLKHTDFSETSQDGTLEKTLALSIQTSNAKEVIDIIKDELRNDLNKKIGFKSLIDKLTNKPIGMRRGIIPLFLATAISQLTLSKSNSISVLITQGKVELEVSGELLFKIVYKPEVYSFTYLKINDEKITYINSLFELFKIEHHKQIIEDLNLLTKKIKNEILNLPRIIINCTKKDNPLNLEENSILFKDEFLKTDINNYDLFFDILPSTLNSNFKKILSEVKKIKADYVTKLDLYIDEIKGDLVSKFGDKKSNLKTNYDLWFKKHIKDEIIFKESSHNKLHQTFKTIGYDDIDSLNSLVIAFAGNSVFNWSTKQKNDFFIEIDNFKTYIESYQSNSKKITNKQNKTSELSIIGKTLKNNLEETLDDYADSVDNIEKVAILEYLLKGLKG